MIFIRHKILAGALLAALALALPGGTVLTCARGESREAGGEELVFDLIDGFGGARVEDAAFPRKYAAVTRYAKLYRDPWSSVSPRIVRVGFTIDEKKMFQSMRRAVYLGASAGAPCRISVPLAVRKGGRSYLSFSLGGYRCVPGMKRDFRVTLRDGKEAWYLYPPAPGKGVARIPEKKWTEVSLDLPDRSFDRPVIEMEFRSDAREAEHLFVANPRIYRRNGPENDEPNIIFISVDSLRNDAVNAVVNRYHLTSNIDALAKDGAVFTSHFIVTNWTRPSTITMLSGVCASRTGVNLFYPPVHEEEKDYFYRGSGVTPVTGLLKKRGYITRAIGNNSFIIDYTGIGIDLDFDELSEYETQWEDTIDLTAETTAWLAKNRGKKFFLFLNYNAPHNAYIPPERYLAPLRERIRGIHPWFRAYLGEVAYTDDYLGRLFAELRRLGLYERTIIVLTADHGEIFSPEHEMSPYTDVKAIFSHGQTQLDEELRVPLIIKPARGGTFRNIRVDAQVRSIDVPPTLFDLLGLDVPASFQGKSLLPVIDGKEKGERVVYSEGRMMYSVRAGGYKYAERFYGFGLRPWHWGGDAVTEYAELYDLKNDPHELANIVEEQPGTTARMRALLRKERFQQPDHVILARGPEARGRVRVQDGFFYDMKLQGRNSSLRKVSRREYAFRLADGESLVFQTIPKDPRITVTLEKGKDLLLGRYLLPLADRPHGSWIINSSLGLAQGRPGGEIIALAGEGLFYWHVPSRGGITEIKKEAYLSRDINQLLQKWGYIQGKEKKEKL